MEDKALRELLQHTDRDVQAFAKMAAEALVQLGDLPVDETMTVSQLLSCLQPVAISTEKGTGLLARLYNVIFPLTHLQSMSSQQIGPFDLDRSSLTFPPSPPSSAADVHPDIARLLPYNNYLLDLNHTSLSSDTMSAELGIKYLSKASGAREGSISGILWHEQTRRPLVWLPVKLGRNIRIVVFIVDTGAPQTQICRLALEAFQLETITVDPKININGTPVKAKLSDPNDRYHDINILGVDWLSSTHSTLTVDYHNLTCEIVSLFSPTM